MATYYGYSTINRNKKFRLEDYELLKRDLLNSLLIRQGEMPGRPQIGTSLWDYLFEGITDQSLARLENELKKTIERDPRIVVDNTQFYTRDNGLLVELTVRTRVTTEAKLLSIFFDTETLTANYI